MMQLSKVYHRLGKILLKRQLIYKQLDVLPQQIKSLMLRKLEGLSQKYSSSSSIPARAMVATWRVAYKVAVSMKHPRQVVRRLLGPLGLYFRYLTFRRLVPIAAPSKAVSSGVGLDRCSIYVINLADRTDRLASFREQMWKLNQTSYEVFPGIRKTNGALGCSLSHRDLLRLAESSKKDLIMVCEDDSEFISARGEIDLLIEEFVANEKLDVLCLGFNTPNEWQRVKISKLLSVTENTQTTSCYVIKPHMRSLIESAAARSAEGLAMSQIKGMYEFDLVWKELQAIYFFAVPNKRPVQQIESYSDIEKKITDYGV